MNSLSEWPSSTILACVRTTSVHSHASSSRGTVPNGNPISGPACITRRYGPFARTYSRRARPGFVFGSTHSSSIRVMNPSSASASRAATRELIWSVRSKWNTACRWRVSGDGIPRCSWNSSMPFASARFRSRRSSRVSPAMTVHLLS